MYRVNSSLRSLATGSDFDVAILGGGINGAGLYLTLCRRGYRVALLDNGDLASGTSQPSGMMIWGGHLSLRYLTLLGCSATPGP